MFLSWSDVNKGIKVFWIGFKLICSKPDVGPAPDNDWAEGPAHSQFLTNLFKTNSEIEHFYPNS